LYPDTVDISGGGRMEYQGYVVRTFEREPGKWREKSCAPSESPWSRAAKELFSL
jgi:hypothetical protein